jgi:pyruvate-formate lyase
MGEQIAAHLPYALKEPGELSPRIRWLREFYFAGVQRPWNNEFTCWTTGTPWDVVYDETSYYIVPETYAFLQAFGSSALQAARPVPLSSEFWRKSLPERRAWLIREVMVEHVPKEILPGDLIAGGRFNVLVSRCWTKRESKKRLRRVMKARAETKRFHDYGYGNCGATPGHLVPDYPRVLRLGWRGIHEELERYYYRLTPRRQRGAEGAQLRAMMTAATMARDVASGYASACVRLAAVETDAGRRAELSAMAENLAQVPWEPAGTFWEAVQALWLTHMLVMSDENYPGPGVSFGRIDQYLYPYWKASIAKGMDRELGKEILSCFWIHANTAYDAMIQMGGNQGITSAFGQLVTLSGMGAGRKDMTNDLTYAMLEVIDELSPILEPKPNIRLHRNSPDELLDVITGMVASSQGSPFLLNFDERSMAGMMREAREAGCEDLINRTNVHEYAPVGCLENTMTGNDRSGTVDVNLNLLKAVELALGNGADLVPAVDALGGTTHPVRSEGPRTGDPARFTSWTQFWTAYAEQTGFIIRRSVDLYEQTESIRAEYAPTPYLSCLVRGCAESALDVTQGGAELSFVTIEAVTFATTVDSLLAIKHLVFDKQKVSMSELIAALRNNWEGHETLQAWAKYRVAKYGCDDREADAMAARVMELWTAETWKHRTKSTNRRFRPGMLSWNYWVADGHIMAASADGRPRGRVL